MGVATVNKIQYFNRFIDKCQDLLLKEQENFMCPKLKLEY